MALGVLIAPESVTVLKHGTKFATKIIRKKTWCKIFSYMFPKRHYKRSIGKW